MSNNKTAELLKKVRKIEIKTKGLSHQIFSGEYHSAFKGRGMAFSEVREYAVGDEIRTIDWNVTARFGSPYVKVFEEERELTVILLVDISGSGQFGTNEQLKRDLITEICAVLSFSANQNNDKIGIIFFSNKIEKFIPPKKGKTHTLRIIRELLEFKPEEKGTNISEALRYLNNTIKKRCIAFVLSDFMDNNFEDSLKIANKKHDVVALKIEDQHEEKLPSIGLVQFKDAETEKTAWINTFNPLVRKRYKVLALKKKDKINNILKRSGVDFATVKTGESYVKPIMQLFKKRG